MIKVLAVVLVVTVSGCASFDRGKVPKTTLSAYQNNGDPKPTLSYSSIYMHVYFSKRELPELAQRYIEREFLSVLESSDYFGRISKQDESADISIEVILTKTENRAATIPAILTGLSFGAIPSWGTYHFDLVAKVKRQDGLEKEYVLTDSITQVIWLPMILALENGTSVVSGVRKNMYKKVLADMKKDGFFLNKKSTLSLAK